MSSTQQDVTREVMRAVNDFLGGPTPDGDDWRLEFGEHLHSNWGAVYGGAIAAAMLAVARSATPERSPRSMHIQIIRSVPSGQVWTSATVRHPGRTVATVEVELFDQRRKLAAIALLTMVTPDAVVRDHDQTAASPPFRFIETPFPEDAIVPGANASGIVAALKISAGADGGLLRADNVRPSVDGSAAVGFEFTVPWEDLQFTGPEAACLAADAVVNHAVFCSNIPIADVGPNPDLTLRFTTAPATRVIAAASSMLSVQRGTTTVGIEVQAGPNQLAHGLATSLLLHSS